MISHSLFIHSPVLVQAAVTKFHRPSGLNKKHLFLRILEARKLKIMALGESVSGNVSSWFSDDHLLPVSLYDGERLSIWCLYLLGH